MDPLSPPQAGWLRLRTLVMLRWFAILGQSLTTLVAARLLGFHLPTEMISATICAAALVNLAAAITQPPTLRLSERGAFLALLFDIVQIGVLLFLTGGLSNPFVLLILAPVTIGATALGLRSSMILAGSALAVVTLLGVAFMPLHGPTDALVRPPQSLIAAMWVSMVVGILFITLYARRVMGELLSMNRALAATQLALQREQQLTAMGGVVAAAAHELGTPLATIKLVSSELADELSGQPRDDVLLIREQANRCRDILRSMGRTGKDDAQIHHAPLIAVVEEAADPHLDRGKRVVIRSLPELSGAHDHPTIARRSEVIHGLRNLVQNAVDFADEVVWVDLDWDATRIAITISDDGPGFPPDLIGRLGDPFLRSRASRRSYEGMGLGLFIAKTLLERSGATLSFANGVPEGGGDAADHPPGALVEILWIRGEIETPKADTRRALGTNAVFPAS